MEKFVIAFMCTLVLSSEALAQSKKPLAISPSAATVAAGASQNFILSFGRKPYSYSAIGGTVRVIDSSTVSFTASTTAGAAALTVRDAQGKSTSAKIMITEVTQPPTPPPPTPTPVPPPAPTPPPPTANLGPYVDPSNWPTPQPGVNTEWLFQTGYIPPASPASDWEHDGAFRLLCNWSTMNFDDPIVYPGQQGAAHHHTFFGNTAIDYTTTSENIRSRGNATCRGGTINLSGYWVPSMIDTTTSKPLAPKSLLIYYKTGLWTYFNDGSIIQPFPKGLKMIIGNAKATTVGGAQGRFYCFMPSTGTTRPGTEGPSIPTNCQAGDELRTHIDYPQCWDGKNLDSADHKSHMSHPIAFWTGDPARQYRCPTTHPVVLPKITFIVQYNVTVTNSTSNWRLSSDHYDKSLPAGYSLHGDWMNGWDPIISDLWAVKCMRDRRDCGSANLGDGRQTLEFQGN